MLAYRFMKPLKRSSPQTREPVREVPIDATCLRCGFKLAWKAVTGRKSIVALLWLVLFLPLYASSVYPPGERQAQFRTVRRVVDGDTLVLENKERVRLIGVDTPETKHPNKPVEYFGKEASRFTKTMCEGKRVRLEFDQANAHIGHKDRYKRTLAYVFLEDGTFLNAEIIKQGYGFAYTRFPFKYMDEFRGYQREARKQGRGLWGRFAAPPTTGKTAQPAASDLTKAIRRPFFIIGLYRTRHPTFVYSQPREYSSKMFKLKKGSTVNVVSIYDDWLKITYQHGKTPGFIKKDSLIP